MEGKIINQNHLNMKNEFEKKIKKKLFNMVKSSKNQIQKYQFFSQNQLILQKIEKIKIIK